MNQISAIAAATEEIVLPVGRDCKPVVFILIDDVTALACCIECSRGTLQADLVEGVWQVPSVCEEFCEAEPVPLKVPTRHEEALPAPSPVVRSIPALSVKLPLGAVSRAFKLGTSRCSRCARYLSERDSHSTTCGHCRDESKGPARPDCKMCGCGMNGRHKSAIYCGDCLSLRNKAANRKAESRRNSKTKHERIDSHAEN